MKLKKLFIIMVILLSNILCAVPCHCESSASVSLNDISAKAGDAVEIVLSLANCEKFLNINLEINYDKSAMTLTNVTAKNINNITTTSSETSKNPFVINLTGINNVSYNGELATLTFKLSENATGEYAIYVDYYKGAKNNYIDGKNLNFYESETKEKLPLNLEYKNGKIIVDDEKHNEMFMGDVYLNFNLDLHGKNILGKIYVATYDDCNRLIDTKLYDANNSVDISIKKIGSYAFVMWWNNEMVPLCNPLRLDL